MKNNFLNKSVANIYFKPSPNSEVVSQILYGEKFKILLKGKKYIKRKQLILKKALKIWKIHLFIRQKLQIMG